MLLQRNQQQQREPYPQLHDKNFNQFQEYTKEMNHLLESISKPPKSQMFNNQSILGNKQYQNILLINANSTFPGFKEQHLQMQKFNLSNLETDQVYIKKSNEPTPS